MNHRVVNTPLLQGPFRYLSFPRSYSIRIGILLCLFIFCLGCSESETEKVTKTPAAGSHKAETKGVKAEGENPLEETSEGGDTRSPSDFVSVSAAVEQIRLLARKEKCNRVMGCPPKEKLVSMGPAAIPDLLRALQIAPAVAPFRPLILETIGLIGDKRAVNPLLKEIHSSVWMIQAEACVALGRIGDQSALPHLQRLKESTSLSLGTAAGLAYSLHLLGESESLNRLVGLASPEAIQKTNWGFTQYALSLLRQTGDPRALAGGIAALKHKNFFLRNEGLETLKSLKLPIPIEVFTPLLEDPIPSIRKSAQHYLKDATGLRAMSAKEAMDTCTQEPGICAAVFRIP